MFSVIRAFKHIINIAIFLVLSTSFAHTKEQNTQTEDAQDKCQCSLEEIINVTKQYPSLQGREIGEALLNKEGEKEIWPRALPFFAQEVLDLGFDLPKTFGIAIIPNTISQDLTLKNLKVGINDSEMVAIDFVQFGSARAHNDNLQIKADVWLFPFLNLYVTYGKMLLLL